MSDFETYDIRVRVIRAYNQPALDGFRAWLEQSELYELDYFQCRIGNPATGAWKVGSVLIASEPR